MSLNGAHYQISIMRDRTRAVWHHVAVSVITDSHRVYLALSEGGFDEQQAQTLTSVFQEFDLSNLATKDDLEKLELRMTVRLGSLIAAGVAFLAFLKLFP